MLAITAVFSMATNSVTAAPSADLWERWSRHDAQSVVTIDHRLWSDFLSRYVSPNTDGINRVESSRRTGSCGVPSARAGHRP